MLAAAVPFQFSTALNSPERNYQVYPLCAACPWAQGEAVSTSHGQGGEFDSPSATNLPLRRQVQTMNSGRKEKRSRQRLEVWLSVGEQQVFGERASTEDISTTGMRVQTTRPWKPESRLRVKATIGDLRATARVVYCQSLAPNTFALGLELARTRGA
jgi:PilZ domain